MAGKSSSNKPSKAGQASRTEANKKKYKARMAAAYVAKHGSEEGMPDWNAKPDFTSKKQTLILDIIQGKKELSKEQISRVRKAGFTWKKTK